MGYFSSWYYGGSGSTAAVATAAYASCRAPKFVYYAETVSIVDGTNDEFVFTEGAGNLTATITAGTYTWGALSSAVKTALEAAGAGTYTVTYSHSTRKYTIVKSAGTFTLDVGAAGADDALPTLGFTADKTGALTYTSDAAVPSTTTVTCTQLMRFPALEDESSREDVELENGRRESALLGTTERISFMLEFETTAVAQALYDMWRQAGRYGATISFYPDASSGDYIDVLWDQKRFPFVEMARSRGLYRLYEGDLAFRVKVPAAGTLTARSFMDRRPS